MDEKDNPLFRKEALEKISSPEQIDQLIQVTLPRGWIALIGTLLLLLGIIAWSIWGRLETVNISPCILYPIEGGPARISTDQQGIVTQLLAPSGKLIKQNSPLIQLQITDKTGSKPSYITVKSPFNGKWLDYYVVRGQFINAGTPIGVLQPMQSEQSPLVAHIFVRPEDGKWIKQGMSALISLDQEDPVQYGYITGKVTFVSPYPLSQLGMMHAVQNEYLAATMSQTGAPFQALVTLNQDPNKIGSYERTKKEHIQETISPGSLCQARIVINSNAPIRFVIPNE